MAVKAKKIQPAKAEAIENAKKIFSEYNDFIFADFSVNIRRKNISGKKNAALDRKIFSSFIRRANFFKLSAN